MALLIFYGVLSTSAAVLLLWLCSGAVVMLFLALCCKLAIFPMHGWLLEIHAQLPTIGSMVLSGIFVKLGWIGLLTYGYRTSIPLLVCCYSALYGVMMLSLSLLSIFHIKRYLAIMTVLHTNIFLGFMFLSCGSLECMGLSYQHSVASRGLLLIAGYRADHCTSKRLLIIRGRLLPWL